MQSDLRSSPSSSTSVIFTSSVMETGSRSMVSFKISQAGHMWDLFCVKSAKQMDLLGFTSSLAILLVKQRNDISLLYPALSYKWNSPMHWNSQIPGCQPTDQKYGHHIPHNHCKWAQPASIKSLALPSHRDSNWAATFRPFISYTVILSVSFGKASSTSCHIETWNPRHCKAPPVSLTLVSIFLATASMEEVRIPENCLREINRHSTEFISPQYTCSVRSSWN